MTFLLQIKQCDGIVKPQVELKSSKHFVRSYLNISRALDYYHKNKSFYFPGINFAFLADPSTYVDGNYLGYNSDFC